METKVVGYIRVSTARQVSEGVSMDAQESRIRAWAEANGAGGVAIFQDAGMSGRRARNRPGLAAALASVDQGSVLVVYSLSRLARSLPDLFAISEALKRRGADLVSLTEKIDTTGAAGKFLFNILGALAEFESAQIGERVKAVWGYKRGRGEKTGGSVPFGYCVRGKRLVPKAAEFAAVQSVLAQRKRGYTLRGIAARLEADGIRRKAGGSKWNAQAVNRILGAAVLRSKSCTACTQALRGKHEKQKYAA